MGVTFFRPGQRLIVPGVQVWQPSMAAASSWWLSGGISAANCVAAYAPKGSASLAASYTNLANPGTYNAAPGVAPTFNTATGWTFNGSTQYLTTGIVPSGDQTWSVLVKFSNWSVDNSRLIGAFSVLEIFRVPFFYRSAAQSSTMTAISSGVIALAGRQGYQNGSVDGSTIPSGSVSGTTSFYIAARNVSNSASQFASVDIQALAIYNTTLTSGQVASLTTAMNAL